MLKADWPHVIAVMQHDPLADARPKDPFRWFNEIGMDDLPSVGGKNASLGEMRRALTPSASGRPMGLRPRRMPTARSCARPISSA